MIRIKFTAFVLVWVLIQFAVANKAAFAQASIGTVQKLLNTGAYDSSLVLLNKLIRKDSTNQELYCYRGIAYYYLLDSDNSIADFSKSILLMGAKLRIYAWPDNEINDPYLFRGEAYGYLKNNYDSASKDLEKSISLNPSNPTAYYKRGAVKAEVLKNNIEAISDVSIAIKLDSMNFTYWFMRGSLNFDEQQFAFAIYDLERARSLPNSLDVDAQTDLYFRLGTSYSRTENCAKALQIFNTSLGVNPTDATTYFNAAVCYNKLGNNHDACLYLQKACDLGEDDGCKYYSALTCDKYKIILNDNCNELSLDELTDIMKAEGYERERLILSKGFIFSHIENEQDKLYNSGTVYTRKYYIKCHNSSSNSDFYCDNKIFLSWNLQDNSISYSTSNQNTFEGIYNFIVSRQSCEKMQSDISMSDVNKIANSESKTFFMEIYCCQNNCYLFTKINRVCENSTGNALVYTVALRPR